MSIEPINSNAITSVVDSVKSALENPLISAGTAGVVGLGTGLAIGSVIGNGGSSSKKKKRTRSGRARDRRFKSKQKHEQRYKRKKRYKIYGKKGWIMPKKSRSRRGKVHFTKNGQPYVLMKNGKARFIKRRGR